MVSPNEPKREVSICGHHKGPITSIAFHPSPLFLRKRKQTSPQGQMATSSLDGTVNILNYSISHGIDKRDKGIDTNQMRVYRFVGHTGPVNNICFSPSGSLIASCSSDKTCRLWVPKANGNSVVLHGHSAPVKDIDFSWRGEGQGTASLLLTCSDDKTVKVWDLPSKSFRSSLVGHTNWVQACKFSSDSNNIAASGGDDETVRIWDIEKSANLITYAATNSSRRRSSADCNMSNQVCKLSFHSSIGSLLAVSLTNGSVDLYDLRTDCLVQSYPTGMSSGIAFHPHGNHMVTSASAPNKGFTLWDIRNHNQAFSFDDGTSNLNMNNRPNKHIQSCCSFSSDGSKLATSRDGKEAFLWSFDIANDKTENDIREEDIETHKNRNCVDSEETVVYEDITVEKKCNTEHFKGGENIDLSGENSKDENASDTLSSLDRISKQLEMLIQTVVLIDRRLTIQEDAISRLTGSNT